ncbi:MAG: hypothetical protein ACREMJ_12180 [Gemmatimonadales bacterium]
MTRRALSLSTLLLAAAGTASAQVISIRTVPVSQADQFEIFPSHNLGMGGVAIALADTVLDPFRNPALGARLGGPRLFGSPALYSVSRDAGGGRALPLAAFLPAGHWFGGLALALQEVDEAGTDLPQFRPPVALDQSIAPGPIPSPRSPRSHGNAFVHAAVGRRLPSAGLSVGASVFWADLHGVDGVDLLYAGSDNLRQDGHATDVRLGLLKEWSGNRSLEAVLVHNRFNMTHDVTYLDPFWDPGTQQVQLRPRLEHNVDRTNIWGLHLEYERPLGDAGWRVGWLATANLMSHPKIPNYELQNIPRDPGHSSAYNFGLGFSRTTGPATFGVDLIYEPIWSNTWAEAAEPMVTRLGDTIPTGGKTIENDFRFSNALLRLGVSRELEGNDPRRGAAFQLGLVVRSIHYWLAQYDNVQVFGRNQEERWIEWTPTWGLSLRFPEFEIRYRGRVTHGTGRPGVGSNGGFAIADAAGVRSGGILLAPSGPLTLDEVSVVAHQVSLSLPLR